MKKTVLSIILFFNCLFCIGQVEDNTAILKVILAKYYANEKVIVKNRLQLLNFYCNKAPNNEETLETISKSEFLKKNAEEIKKQIDITKIEDWSKEYDALFNNQNQYLKRKVNACLSFEAFQEIAKKYGENNQRLLIINIPIYFAKNYCLVKIGFYRNIEHNSGCYLLLEKINNQWIIKEKINEWNT